MKDVILGHTIVNYNNLLEDFNKPKVVYPETTQGAYFAYDEEGIFLDKTCFMLISKDAKYIQASLSSQLFEFAYKKMYSSVELGQNGFQYNKHSLIKLPLRKINEDSISDYSDGFFYEMYGISPEEITYIEEFVISHSI